MKKGVNNIVTILQINAAINMGLAEKAMNTYAMGAEFDRSRGQFHLCDETNLTMRTTIGTIIRRIPLMT